MRTHDGSGRSGGFRGSRIRFTCLHPGTQTLHPPFLLGTPNSPFYLLDFLPHHPRHPPPRAQVLEQRGALGAHPPPQLLQHRVGVALRSAARMACVCVCEPPSRKPRALCMTLSRHPPACPPTHPNPPPTRRSRRAPRGAGGGGPLGGGGGGTRAVGGHEGSVGGVAGGRAGRGETWREVVGAVTVPEPAPVPQPASQPAMPLTSPRSPSMAFLTREMTGM